MLFNILVLISTLIVITVLRRLVTILPSLLACMVRGKENINLEASVKHSYDRNAVALSMVIPFCLAVAKFRLYDPSFMSGMGEDLRIGVIFGVFAAYLAIRRLARAAVQGRRSGKKVYDIGIRSSYTFFIILALLLIAAGGVLSFIGVETGTVRIAMLWISASIYALMLLRKFQIFISGFSIFTAFLYLCALEMIPTGLLIVSAVV